MKFGRSNTRSAGALLAALIFKMSGSLAPAETYHVTDLGVIAGQTISHPGGINNQGQVAGYSGSHAARFTNGAVEDLGTIPGGSISTGVAINDLGQVVGDSQYSVNGGSIRHAALWSNGTVTDLGILPSWGNYSRGNGINKAGEVVGHSGGSLSTTNTHAFIWDAVRGMRDIGTLGGAYAKAFSINNSSVATGTSQALSGGFQAFIWDEAGGMRNIGTIAGNTSSGNFINDNGHVAGTSTINGFDNRQHAFLYDGTTMRDLGAIGNNDFLSDRSSGYGINIHDVVVGSTYRPYLGGSLYQVAFVYRDGQMLDLETLVDGPGADYHLSTATGINDAGQIAVDAIKRSTGQIHAVLLTPNPELLSAVSRKTHSAAGIFDVNLPLSGTPAVECRSDAGAYTLVFTFNNDIAGGNASVTEGVGTVTAGGASHAGKVMSVDLTGVADRQTITVTLTDVTDAFGQTLPPTDVRMSVLVGDINGNGLVNGSDVSQAKANIGAPITQANVRCDVVPNGSINSSDIGIVKAASGGGISSETDR